MNTISCRICLNKIKNKLIFPKEMMLGKLEKFDYMLCNNCGCLQICQVPKNLSEYYPSDYYSFDLVDENFLFKQPRKFFRDYKNNYSIFKKGLFGNFLNSVLSNSAYNFLSKVNLNKDSSILDVGSGNGMFLHGLKSIGFNNVLGIDTFIKNNIKYKNNLEVLKKSIFQINDKFDFIILNHSFEHMSDHSEVLKKISQLLNSKGVCIIRTPTVDSYSWKFYKENWVQLDAPRHLIIHSLKSFKLLLKKHNMKIYNYYNDSTSFQFWGSEQYKNNIPLYSKKSYLFNPSKSIFKNADIQKFEKKAKILNKNKKGDQVVYYIMNR
ncbi:class I SAM-dependent methyltransferase [Flavobacteriaceae bacterium]|nr:class I SAM-dependent methyltransferase [Flavobacteriaceae bacterium]